MHRLSVRQCVWSLRLFYGIILGEVLMADKKGTTYKEYSNFLDVVFADDEVAKLIRVSALEEFNPEMQEILKSLYSYENGNAKRLGSIINAIFTQQNSVFTLSVRMVHRLVKADQPRHGLASCELSAYNDIVHKALNHNVFEKMRDQIGKKAALYKLVHPQWLGALQKQAGKELLLAKEHKFTEWWDATSEESDSIQKPERVLTEEQKEARRIADDIFKRK